MSMSVAHCTDVCTERYCTRTRTRTWAAGMIIAQRSTAEYSTTRGRGTGYRPAGGITSGTKYSYSYDLGTTQKRATRGILYEYSYEYSTDYADRRYVQLYQGLMNSRSYCTFVQVRHFPYSDVPILHWIRGSIELNKPHLKCCLRDTFTAVRGWESLPSEGQIRG